MTKMLKARDKILHRLIAPFFSTEALHLVRKRSYHPPSSGFPDELISFYYSVIHTTIHYIGDEFAVLYLQKIIHTIHNIIEIQLWVQQREGLFRLLVTKTYHVSSGAL